MIKEKLLNYSSVYVFNFHTAYLLYPFKDPHGKSNSGLATFSKYKVDDVIRKQFEVTKNIVSKLFDLDRCFTVTYIPTCRSASMPYEKDKSYTVVIDGFIVSKNVTPVYINNIDLSFMNSDHNPVYMEFILEY